MDESTKKNSGVRYPAEFKKKALSELAESGDTGAVARHYNINKQPAIKQKALKASVM